MGLEVYYPQDIANALEAAHRTLCACIENGTIPPTFAAGFRSALDTVATNFGIPTRYVLDNLTLSMRFTAQIEKRVTLERETSPCPAQQRQG